MSNPHGSDRDASKLEVYEIRLRGHLSPQWTDWFEELSITPGEDGNTLLTGIMVDQAALHGILKRVRDLGMPLLSVNVVGSGKQGTSDNKQRHHE